MKTKDQILEELRNEVKSNHEDELLKLRNKQEYDLRKKFFKYFLGGIVIVAIIYFASVVVINQVRFAFIGLLVYVILIAIFMFSFMEKYMSRYVKKHLVLPIITIDIDEEVKKLINTKLIDLTNEVFDLDLAISETKEELALLEEIQKETN